MDLAMRQGTVYEEKKTKKRFILINHNPMELCSLRLWSEGGDAPFNLAKPEFLLIDDLIALRRSGEYEELGDLPKEIFNAMANALSQSGVLPEKDAKLVKSLIQES